MNIDKCFRFYKDNEAVKLNEIDQIACEVFNTEISSKYYASPEEMPISWFDYVGGAATESSRKEPDWDLIRSLVIAQSGHIKTILNTSDEQERDLYIKSMLEFNRPYIEFIDELDKRGYIVKVFDNI